MIKKIGTGETGAPLVQAKLDPAEKEGLENVLYFAGQAIKGRDGDAIRSTRAMLDELCRVFEIEIQH